MGLPTHNRIPVWWVEWHLGFGLGIDAYGYANEDGCGYGYGFYSSYNNVYGTGNGLSHVKSYVTMIETLLLLVIDADV